MKRALILSSVLVLLCVAGCATTPEGEMSFLGMTFGGVEKVAETTAPLLPPPWNMIVLGIGGIAGVLGGKKGVDAIVKKFKESPEGKII